MRKSALYILFIAFAASISFVMCSNTDKKTEEQKLVEENLAFKRLKAKADSAKMFCKQKDYNMQYCILIDFSIHSGKNRFFVWDFAKDTIRHESLCCHGYGKESTQSKPVFSNVEGSYCSSLGKYKMGVRSYSSWGINAHYKMHGLEKTNNNAFKRIVVLHSHNPVPEEEIYPNHLPLGWSQGCSVISNNIMRRVDALLKDTKKPVLMWIYN
ncbi:MAG: murein L,D-transpeptidase catalytic domain-containing protein [Dysgonomonas sp.]